MRSDEAVTTSGDGADADEEEEEEQRWTNDSVRPIRRSASQRILSRKFMILVRTKTADGESRPECDRVIVPNYNRFAAASQRLSIHAD